MGDFIYHIQTQMKKTLLFIVGLVLWVVLPASANKVAPMEALFDYTSSFFKPVKGKILKQIGSGQAFINIGAQDGVMKAMRLRVYRPGVAFRHPLTKELIGTTDEPVGLVEVVEVYDSKALVNLIEGQMKTGYKVATPSEPFRLLFHQDTGTDYYWADRYHKKLSKIKAITIVDAPIEDWTLENLFKVSDKKDIDLILTLSGYIERDQMVVTQRLLWADGVEVFKKTVDVPLEEVRKLQVQSGQKIIPMDQPLLVFTLPMDAKMMAFGDFDGDNVKEIAIATDGEVFIYRLHPADLEEVGKFNFTSSGGLIWLDSLDLNGDGQDELLYTIFNDIKRRPLSYIARFTLLDKDKTETTILWKQEGFLRRFHNQVLYQKYSNEKEIWDSGIYILKNMGNRFVTEPYNIKLPKGTDIYGFTTIKDSNGIAYSIVIDNQAHLRLYDNEGRPVLSTNLSLGGFDRAIRLYEDPFTEKTEDWYIKDRSLTLSTQVLLIKRKPVSEATPGLGYSSSNIISVWIEGAEVKSSYLLKELSGSIRDFHMEGKRLYVLQSPVLGLSLRSLLSGRGINATKLLIYKKRLGQ